jgi:hypothetical protein
MDNDKDKNKKTTTTLVLFSGAHQCGNILLSSPKCGAAALSQAG